MKYGIRPHFLISLHCLKNFKITECAHRLHQNKITERRQIQLVLAYQKYWSNSIFHFIFLQKVSFRGTAGGNGEVRLLDKLPHII